MNYNGGGITNIIVLNRNQKSIVLDVRNGYVRRLHDISIST